MVEALVNYLSAQHLFFGFGTGIIISILLRLKFSNFTIPVFIIILWEFFEYRTLTYYWINNIGNQIADVIIGILGIVVGNILIEKVVNRSQKSQISN